MEDVTDDWQRVATYLRSARDELGESEGIKVSQAELAERAGVSESTIRVIETARRQSYGASTLRKIARAVGWRPDSIKLILDGGEPEMADDDQVVERQELHDLLVSIDDRLAEVQASIDERLARIEGRLDELATARAPSTDFDPGEALAERRAQPGPRAPVGLPTGPGAPRDEEAESSGGGRRAG